MSEAPERIFARFATTGPGVNIRKWSTAEFSEAEAIYLRSDTAIPKAEADAMVAAAYEQAQHIVQLAWEWPESEASSAPACEAIAKLCPSDARVALDKIVEAERERCAEIAETLFPNDSTGEVIAAAIRETGKKEIGK